MAVDLSTIERDPNWKPIEPIFDRWKRVLDQQVEFSLSDSAWHTNDHCTRVMAYALLMGSRLGLSEDALDALGAAAAFHDSRRKDDGYDVGHGKRAAEYYESSCRANGLAFDERAYLAMAYHDRDDEIGLRKIEDRNLERGVGIFNIFKDADGLDRLRLGPRALDESMLRTQASKELLPLAQELCS